MPRYNHATIEPKWQAYWDEHQTFATPRMPKPGTKKLYALDMFPYPSGDGLHVGHPEGYTATDIVCRAARMQGRSVIHPMGFDAFGLPAEEHAIKTGEHPRSQTEKNIATFRRQLKSLGFSYDWSRELATTDVEYFRWTQWIFLQIYDTWFDAEQQRGRPISELPVLDDVRKQGDDAIRAYQDEHRLAFQIEAPVNWCPALGTVLANEEVVNGKSEVGNHPVVRMPLRQWMLRITAYADRLEKDLESLDWPEAIKAQQRNWIGKSTGAEVSFALPDTEQIVGEDVHWLTESRVRISELKTGESLKVYTTRPDTLFGATYMVIAPEHPLLETLTKPQCAEHVIAYCDAAARKSDLERTELAKDKTGVFTGSYATNPVNDEPVPVWVADYVLISYGTGAIMAVPAHDERDFEFAEKFGIPIKPVVDPGDSLPAAERDEVLAGKRCFAGEGVAINSQHYDGLTTAEFKKRITADLASIGLGREAVNYKLRDWLFSRQRFWGEPFPILHELDAEGKPTCRVRAVDEKDLPVDLPHLEDFKPHGRPEPPLDKAPAEWLYVTVDGKQYKRETNTMPQWAGSCWYYLRFLDPRNKDAPIDPAIEKAWMPVDLYVGGAEHAVLHLLYSRFWHKVLFDRGIVSTPEPFQKLVNQGMILGQVEYRGVQHNGKWVSNNALPENIRNAIEVVTLLHTEEIETASYKGKGKYLINEAADQWIVFWLTDDEVEKVGSNFVVKNDRSIRVDARVFKMSKSRGNVINPDDIVTEYGADSLRLYEMFMGPLEATKPWSMQDVNGVRSFLNRVWRLIIDDRAETMTLNVAIVDRAPTTEENRVLHQTIQAVTDDIAKLSFNTAIARMMEFTNFFTSASERPREAMEKLVLLLSPFAPHVAEELWQALGHSESLAHEQWPEFDPSLAKEDSIDIPVQINGKVRSKITVPAEADTAQLETAARADAKVIEHVAGKQIVKVIVVPGRLVNIVVK
jgi:leucyl-tRNA synthetase